MGGSLGLHTFICAFSQLTTNFIYLFLSQSENIFFAKCIVFYKVSYDMLILREQFTRNNQNIVDYVINIDINK